MDKLAFERIIPTLPKLLTGNNIRSEVNAPVVASIAERISQVSPDTPGYWPAAFSTLSVLTGYSIVDTRTIMPALFKLDGDMVRDNFGDVAVELKGRGTIIDSVFTHCIVKVTSVETIRFKNVRFINCIIIIPPVESPNDVVKSIAQQLLKASDIRNVTINTV